jgi:hypothetical protein
MEIQFVSMISVVTQFWTPRAGDGVYLFWTECRSLAHIRQKIDKSTERNNFVFWNLVWAVFYSFFLSFPFTTKIIRFSYVDQESS